MPGTTASPFLWIGFALLVLGMLVVDLGVMHRQPRKIEPREAVLWTLVWVGVALLFNGCVYFWYGRERALEFLTGYLIEKALSVDNLFVFLIIFSYFSVPLEYQHRVLFWGVLGAILLRAAFIMAGAALLHTFHWIIFVFGGLLVFTGFKVLMEKSRDMDLERNPVLLLFRRMIPMTRRYYGPHFTVLREGHRYATPLLLVLVVVEVTDVLFAMDSIPAIFAVTPDSFIVFTSNIFAVLGLRALYFLIARIIDHCRYLKVGLGLVLVFIGAKMLVSDWYKMPIWASLTIVLTLLTGSVLASLTPRPRPRRRSRTAAQRHTGQA